MAFTGDITFGIQGASVILHMPEGTFSDEEFDGKGDLDEVLKILEGFDGSTAFSAFEVSLIAQSGQNPLQVSFSGSVGGISATQIPESGVAAMIVGLIALAAAAARRKQGQKPQLLASSAAKPAPEA